MNTIFDEITKPSIKAKLAKKNTSVLALIIFYETIVDKKAYIVLSFFIYTVIKNYVCIDYLAGKPKQLSGIPVDSGGDPKNGDKSFDRILGIGIPDLLMNLIYCCGFLKSIYYVVIFKCPKRILEYYF